MVNKLLEDVKMTLEQAIGLEEVYIVDNCLIRTLALEELKKNPRAYFTTKRVLDEHKKWRDIESRDFLPREQRKGHLFRLNELDKPLAKIEELLRSKEYQDIAETARLHDELEGTQTNNFEQGLLYCLRQYNLRLDLTRDKEKVRMYFAKLKKTHALLLEEYRIKIDIEQDRIWLRGNAKENRKLNVQNLDGIITKFDYQAEIQRLNGEKQNVLREGQEFFSAEIIANCFETDLKDQVLYMHAGETFEKYTKLLTKRIIADMLEFNMDNARDYLMADRIDYVVATGINEYKKRIKELDLEGVITPEKIEETKTTMHRVLNRVYNDIRKGKENVGSYCRQYHRSIKSDLTLVCAAFEKRFPTNNVVILSQDTDVIEMIDYLSLAQQAGKIRSQNRVRYSLAA